MFMLNLEDTPQLSLFVNMTPQLSFERLFVHNMCSVDLLSPTPICPLSFLIMSLSGNSAGLGVLFIYFKSAKGGFSILKQSYNDPKIMASQRG